MNILRIPMKSNPHSLPYRLQNTDYVFKGLRGDEGARRRGGCEEARKRRGEEAGRRGGDEARKRRGEEGILEDD